MSDVTNFLENNHKEKIYILIPYYFSKIIQTMFETFFILLKIHNFINFM